MTPMHGRLWIKTNGSAGNLTSIGIVWQFVASHFESAVFAYLCLNAVNGTRLKEKTKLHEKLYTLSSSFPHIFIQKVTHKSYKFPWSALQKNSKYIKCKYT